MHVIRVAGECLDALVGYVHGRVWRLRGTGLLAVPPLILLSGLVVIIPLAYAGPPDPTWIPGIYDDADYDDVVWLVTDGTTGAGTGQWPAPVADGPGTCEGLPDRDLIPTGTQCAEMNRGPPPLEASTVLCSSQPPRSGSPNSLRRTLFCADVNVTAPSC